MNTAKAARGEEPTKIRKAKREELAGYESDRGELNAKLANDFRAMAEPSQIVFAVHDAMANDLPFTRSMLKHLHPNELHLGKELLSKKERLVEAMATFLKAYPYVGDDDQS